MLGSPAAGARKPHVTSACPLEQMPRGAGRAGLPARKEEAAAAFGKMEMGWSMDVARVADVTFFDSFHGFVGLPFELEDEMPFRVPSVRNLICSGNASMWKSQEKSIFSLGFYILLAVSVHRR